MLSEITSDQFQEWKVFDRVEPFGPERQDWNLARIAQILLNTYRDPAKKSEPFTLEEAVLKHGDLAEITPKASPPRRAWEYMKAIGKAMTEQSRQQ